MLIIFKSASHFVLVPFWNYSRDNSLNCTPLGSVTITNWKNCQIGSQQHKHTLTLPKNKRNRYSNSKNFILSHNYCLLINFLQNPHIDCHRKKLLPYHEEWELPEKQRGCVSNSCGCKDQLRAGNYIFGALAICALTIWLNSPGYDFRCQTQPFAHPVKCTRFLKPSEYE